MRYKIGQIALVLGVILIIMGFSTSNVAEWVLGLILLGEEKRIEELLRIAEEEGKNDK
jgi:hypothetical protein